MKSKRIAVALCCALLSVQPLPAFAAEAHVQVQAESLTEMETEGESGLAPETEVETEGKSDPAPEPETEEETEGENEPSSEPETEEETESESEPASEPETEEETESESEPSSEPETEEETESESEPTSEPETEEETESESEPSPELERKPETESESEPSPDTKIEVETEETGDTNVSGRNPGGMSATSGISIVDSFFWQNYPYRETFQQDFRFTQIPKRYGLIGGGKGARVYETPDNQAKAVGEVPYFGLVYILKDIDSRWAYVESGDVRGFLQVGSLSLGDYADQVVDEIGEEGFAVAKMWCSKADNAAFTYTHTTVHDVVAVKQYALARYAGEIYEYQKKTARAVGHIVSGSLVYVLEDDRDGTGWVYVESGDVRGFVPKEQLILGAMASDMVEGVQEEELALAKQYVAPEENRSCYFSLKSVKVAIVSGGAVYAGEQLAQFAQSFVGRLPYVWGGTSLTSGADCSGFTQAIYASFGVQIPRLAQVQGISGYPVASLAEAKPGDLVYWAAGPHIGIYIGDGLVVQCSGGSRNTAANPGRGPTISAATYRPITSIRRYLPEDAFYTYAGGNSRVDGTSYTQDQLELIWAIVAQEDNGSYDGALAVISSAMNRTESPRWSYCGGDALAQLVAPGQYCYSNDNYWRGRLGGNVPDYVKQAVNDCLVGGVRNHPYTCFRSRKGSQTGPNAVQIGGNWFFGS